MKRNLTDADPRREHKRQLRLRTLIDRRFARMFRAEIMRASDLMIKGYMAGGGDPDLPIDHNSNLTAIWRKLIAVSVDVFGSRILDQGKALGLVLEYKAINEEFFLRLIEDFIANEMMRTRIASVTRQTRQTIVNMISAGQTEGLGIDAIGRNITASMPSISRTRAHIIARTETHGAANYASDEAARALGIQMQKEWVAVEDDRTRDFSTGATFSHMEMSGVVVDQDKPFEVPMAGGGFEALMYPGDLSGSAGNTINCRCIAAYIVKE